MIDPTQTTGLIGTYNRISVFAAKCPYDVIDVNLMSLDDAPLQVTQKVSMKTALHMNTVHMMNGKMLSGERYSQILYDHSAQSHHVPGCVMHHQVPYPELNSVSSPAINFITRHTIPTFLYFSAMLHTHNPHQPRFAMVSDILASTRNNAGIERW